MSKICPNQSPQIYPKFSLTTFLNPLPNSPNSATYISVIAAKQQSNSFPLISLLQPFDTLPGCHLTPQIFLLEHPSNPHQHQPENSPPPHHKSLYFSPRQLPNCHLQFPHKQPPVHLPKPPHSSHHTPLKLSHLYPHYSSPLFPLIHPSAAPFQSNFNPYLHLKHSPNRTYPSSSHHPTADPLLPPLDSTLTPPNSHQIPHLTAFTAALSLQPIHPPTITPPLYPNLTSNCPFLQPLDHPLIFHISQSSNGSPKTATLKSFFQFIKLHLNGPFRLSSNQPYTTVH